MTGSPGSSVTEPDPLPADDEAWPEADGQPLYLDYLPLSQPWPIWGGGGGGGVEGGMSEGRVGGRLLAQEYAHSLTSVARSLCPVARRVAFEKVYVRSRKQVRHLVKLWSGELGIELEAKEKKEGDEIEPGVETDKSKIEDELVPKDGWIEESKPKLEEGPLLEDQDDNRAKADKGKRKADEQVERDDSQVEQVDNSANGASGDRWTERSSVNSGRYVLHIDPKSPIAPAIITATQADYATHLRSSLRWQRSRRNGRRPSRLRVWNWQNLSA
ncbi:hypothetical protein CROQUDRAFT_321183 [Cronartium quercuum f. sp. fusiforme G11]|uniref:Uncharacterized protein n=1 Tax=Cronartium quercuum f. sp. fusiforme G11 TaxID=708437 RepID=A0A9P6NNY6_9BASI|nr:hypothetical protein CROQUDRAFT_321183 [Cronartium quercuum f. sp. fusiforme G11]